MLFSRVLGVFIGLCSLHVLFAQQSDFLLKGVIKNTNIVLEGITIENTTSKSAAITNASGIFFIPIALQDTLEIKAVHCKTKKIIVDHAIYSTKQLVVTLDPKIISLQEVVVKANQLSGDLAKDMAQVPKQVSAISLRLPGAYNAPKTKTQRMLYAAKSSPVSLLLNSLNGRIKRLKNQQKLEQKDKELQQLKQFLGGKSFFTTSLQIPHKHIDGFLFYTEVDPVFSRLYKKQDKMLLFAFLKQKSKQYRKLHGLL